MAPQAEAQSRSLIPCQLVSDRTLGKHEREVAVRGVHTMLILTRRRKECIRIAGQIRVILLGFKGGQARVGIEAPPNIAVDREEIFLRKQEEAGRRSATANKR